MAQPYSQLARVYQARGDTQAARKVLVAREKARIVLLSWWRAVLHQVWGWLTAYGYQPWRAVWLLAGLVVVGGLVFAPTTMTASGEAPLAFERWAYSADQSIPIVDLGQAGSWQPQPGIRVGFMYLSIGVGWFLSGAFLAAVRGVFKPDN